jgi:predicted RNase H-like nuclease (RuvC/YqgF family)
MSEDVVTRLERLEKQAGLVKHLKTWNEALEETVRQLTEQNRILEIAVQGQEEAINKLFAYLEKNNSHVLEDSDEDLHMKNRKT